MLVFRYDSNLSSVTKDEKGESFTNGYQEIWNYVTQT